MSSQRHKVENYGASARGEAAASGAVATVMLKQLAGASTELVPPVINTGGPLDGSSMCGAVPNSAIVPGVEAPTTTSIAPNTAVVGGADLVMTVTGTGFGSTTQILFNNGPEPTTYVSPTEVSTTVKPSLASGAGAVPVSVKNSGSAVSNEQTFTFTAAGEELTAETQPAGVPAREFPIGPFNLLRVESIEGGANYVVSRSDGENIQAGDTLRVEATGYTPANGDFELGDNITRTKTETILLLAGEVQAPIEGKGRVTVIAGVA